MPQCASCLDCPFREKGPICGNTDKTVSKFSDDLLRYSIKGKGKAIFNEGQPVDGVFFLCKGVVKLTKWLSEHEETIVDVITPCTVVSTLADIGGIHSLSAVTAEGNVEVAFLRARSPDALASTLSGVQTSIFKAVSELLDRSRIQLAQCSLPVSKRLLSALLRLHRQFAAGPEASFRLPFSFAELAQFVHTTPETVSRTFRKFRREGLISIDRGGMISLFYHPSSSDAPSTKRRRS